MLALSGAVGESPIQELAAHYGLSAADTSLAQLRALHSGTLGESFEGELIRAGGTGESAEQDVLAGGVL